MRLVASAYSIANKAGTIVRKVMAGGDLGIVEKVAVWLNADVIVHVKIEVILVYTPWPYQPHTECYLVMIMMQEQAQWAM